MSRKVMLIRTEKHVILSIRLVILANLFVAGIFVQPSRNLLWYFWSVFGIFTLSEIAFLFEAGKRFKMERIWGWIFLFDTAVISFLIFCIGKGTTEVFVTYALTIAIAAMSKRASAAFFTAILTTAIYTVLTIYGKTNVELLSSPFLLRSSFFFVTALFVGYLSEKVQQEQMAKARTRNHLDERRNFAETELQVSEERYRTLVQTLPDIVYTLDPEGMFTFVNDSVRELGYEPKELMGKHFSEVIHVEDAPYVSRDYVLQQYQGKTVGDNESPKLFDERRTRLRKTAHLEVRLTSKIPSKEKEHIGEIVCEVSASGQYDRDPQEENKQFLGTLGVIRDVTEKRFMDGERQRTNRLQSVGVLAGGIAHDFNNILMVIMGYISLAKEDVDPSDPRFTGLADVEDACVRARNLTQQLLTLAKGGAPITKVTSISELLKGSTRFALHGSNIRADYVIADNLWPVEADTGQMGQVINNLIVNARQAMPKGGIITVRAENSVVQEQKIPMIKPGTYIKISLEDQGSGIPAENLDNIFDPYFTTKQEGSGLGLAICYSIVKKHGGHIFATSKAGVGTTMHIFLPAMAKATPAAKEVTDQSIPGKGKILFMDDEEIVRKTAKVILNKLGYEVECAVDGTEAIDLYEKAIKSGQGFNAVILDLTVPGGMGGRETVSEILRIDPEAKCIVSSGYSSDPIMSQFKDHGFHDVVPKPYMVRDLSKVLHRVITGSV